MNCVTASIKRVFKLYYFLITDALEKKKYLYNQL